MINDAGAAQDILRETLIRAAECSDFPDDPGSLRDRLFTLAREQCLARPESGLPGGGPGAAGETGVPPWQVAPPLMAWRAVMSLARPEREVLAFAAWQSLTPAQAAAVTGLPVPHLRELLSRAEEQLRRAVAAEVMAGPEAKECAQRAAILASGQGPTAATLRDQLLRHAESCPACGGQLPQRVSAAKIYRLLPFPVLTPQLASELLGTVTAARESRLASRAGLAPDPAAALAGKAEPGRGAEEQPGGKAGQPGGTAAPDWTPPAHRVVRWPGRRPSAAATAAGPQAAAAPGSKAGQEAATTAGPKAEPPLTPRQGQVTPAAPEHTPAAAGPAGAAAVPGTRAEPPLTPRPGLVPPSQPVPAAAGRQPGPAGGDPVPPAVPAAGSGQAAGDGQAATSGQTVLDQPAAQPGKTGLPAQPGPAAQPGQPAAQPGQTVLDQPAAQPGKTGPAAKPGRGAQPGPGAQPGKSGTRAGGKAGPTPAAPSAPAGATPADRKPVSGPADGLDLVAGGGTADAARGTDRPGGRGSTRPGGRAGAGPDRGGRPGRRRHSGRWLAGAALMVTVLMVVFGWLVPYWSGPGGGLRSIIGYGRAPLPARPVPRVPVPGQPGGYVRAHRNQAGGGQAGTAPSVTGHASKPVVGAQLMAYPGALDLGYRSAGTIVIAAPHGPVTWSARSSSAQVRLSRQAGTLGRGQRAGLAVAVRSAGGGSAFIEIWPGALTIPVTWSAPGGCTPSPSPPPPSPSPAPSPSPPGTPTPAPDPPASSPGSPTTSGPDSGSPTPSPPAGSGSGSPSGSGSAAAANGPGAGYQLRRAAAHCGGARVIGPGGTPRSGPVTGR